MLNVAGPEEPIVIHGVQHVFHPPVRLEAWPNDDRSSKIVFIVRDLKPEMFEHTLKAFNEDSAAPPAPASAIAPAQIRAEHIACRSELAWSGWRESNPHRQLGKLTGNHYIIPARVTSRADKRRLWKEGFSTDELRGWTYQQKKKN